MELNEMKNMWKSVDMRLSKDELLKDRIILEIIHGKANKSVSRLMCMEFIGLIIPLLVLPFIIGFFSTFGSKVLAGTILFISVGIIIILNLFWSIFKIYGLMKIDFSKNISENIYYINRYNIQIKWEKFATVIIGLGIGFLCSIYYMEVNANLTAWAYATSIFLIVILYIYWVYSRFYRKNIDSIKKSLDELKELDE